MNSDAAVPSDVRKVSDLPEMFFSLWGWAPFNLGRSPN